MDFVKKAMDSSKGSSSDSKPADSKQGGSENMDYVDKAWDFASKKAGHDFDRQTDEKITDGARSAYEKFSGKQVSDKVSN